MQIHVVLGLNGPESVVALQNNIERVYEDRFLPLEGRPAWLVADDALARDISDKLGFNDGQDIAGLVTTVATYYGRANPDVWAWMKMMYERPQPTKGEVASNVVVQPGTEELRERLTANA